MCQHISNRNSSFTRELYLQRYRPQYCASEDLNSSKMPDFSWKSVVLKWNIFWALANGLSSQEYFPVFMKQFGMTTAQIGMSLLFGLYAFLFLIFGYVADRFRARKLVFTLLTVLLVFISLAPLLTFATKRLQKCAAVAPMDVNTLNESASSVLHNFSIHTFSRASRVVNAGNVVETLGENTTTLNEDSGNSMLFLLMVITKVLFETLHAVHVALFSSAVMAYSKSDKTKYGAYYCWGQVGGAISLFVVGMIASRTVVTICGQIQHGYFVVFPASAAMMALSLISVPWMDYEYLEHRVINWTEVKAVLFDSHYAVVLFVSFYSGACYSFQSQWEFWYIDYLSGGPVILAVGGLIRRPLGALFFLLSGRVIRSLGELETMAVALLAFAVSQIALSIVYDPWLVLSIDILQTMGFAWTWSPICIHLSNAGTKASSAVMLSKFFVLSTITNNMGPQIFNARTDPLVCALHKQYGKS